MGPVKKKHVWDELIDRIFNMMTAVLGRRRNKRVVSLKSSVIRHYVVNIMCVTKQTKFVAVRRKIPPTVGPVT